MKRIKRIWIWTAVLLCLLSVLAVSAAEAEKAEPLDFGFPEAGNNRFSDATELFEQLIGASATETERAYLKTLSGFTFTYNDTIPDSVVQTAYDREAGQLRLTLASAYYYTAANGSRVEWIPQAVRVEGRTVPFEATESGGYLAVVNGLFRDGDFDVDVDFAWRAVLPKDVLNSLLTAPRTAAEAALAVLEEYEAALQAWKDQNAAYEAHVAYQQAIQAYEDYLDACRDYEARMEEYAVYLEQLRVQKLYDDWVQFYAYQDFREHHLEQYNQYLAYQARIVKIREKLAPLENLFVTDSHGWQLYASLMGGTVSEVLSRQEELELLGENKEDIVAAGDATEILRTLMNGYADLRAIEYESEHDRLTALYGYYTEHYTELRDQYNILYRTLHKLHNNKSIAGYMQTEGKLEHYQQFVGVLYVTCSALDDGFTRNAGWSIGNKTLAVAVEAITTVPDRNDATPANATMPETEVEEVEAVPEIAEPTEKQPQTRPSPAPMDEPKAPDPVQEPDRSDPPPAVEKPVTQEPTLQLSALEQQLAEQLRAGTLPKRTVLHEDVVRSFSTAMQRTVSNKITVTFYNDDGSLHRQFSLDYGDKIEYLSHHPEKASDDRWHYEFRSWVTRPDNQTPGVYAENDLSLYPLYRRTARAYTVTWILNGEQRVQKLTYGVEPACPFITSPNPTVEHVYSFSGWDKPVVPVTEDVTYTATLEALPRHYRVTWVLGDRTVTESVPYGTVPVFTGDYSHPSDDYSYTFFSWNQAISPVREDVTYVASYQKTPLASVPGGETLQVVYADALLTVRAGNAQSLDFREAVRMAHETERELCVQWTSFSLHLNAEALETLVNSYCRRIKLKAEAEEYGTRFAVSYCNSAGRELAIDLPATVRPAANSAGYLLGVYLEQEDGWLRLPEAGLDVTGACALHVRDVFTVTLLPVDRCNISQIPSFAELGQVIDLDIGCTFGYHVAAARVTTADGEVLAMEGLTFRMPDRPVTVELTVVQTVYHVTFVADGVVLSEADYLLGETIVAPEAPAKASDELYDYTFAGWSKEVTIAIGSDRAPVYEAIFNATLRNEGDPFLKTDNENRFLKIVIPIASVLLLSGIAALVIVIVHKKKKANAKPKKPRNAKQTKKVKKLEKLEKIEKVEKTVSPEKAEKTEKAEPDGQETPVAQASETEPQQDGEEKTKNADEAEEE